MSSFLQLVIMQKRLYRRIEQQTEGEHEKPSENHRTKLADAAFRQAAKNVVKRAKESGTPVIIWEDEQIKRVEPRNMQNTRKRKSEN
jgi:hypothetical protein